MAIFSIIFHSTLRWLPRVTIKVRFFIDDYSDWSGLPVELFCNFVDGKPHISSKHDHNEMNFLKSYFLPYSKHFHPLPGVSQIKAIMAEASNMLWGSRECWSPAPEKKSRPTFYEIRTERTKRPNVWKRFVQGELSKSSSFHLGQLTFAGLAEQESMPGISP